jgi:hypothetical protein
VIPRHIVKPENAFLNGVFALIYEFHWTFNYVWEELPIPVFLELCMMLDEQKKREERAVKRGK